MPVIIIDSDKNEEVIAMENFVNEFLESIDAALMMSEELEAQKRKCDLLKKYNDQGIKPDKKSCQEVSKVNVDKVKKEMDEYRAYIQTEYMPKWYKMIQEGHKFPFIATFQEVPEQEDKPMIASPDLSGMIEMVPLQGWTTKKIKEWTCSDVRLWFASLPVTAETLLILQKLKMNGEVVASLTFGFWQSIGIDQEDANLIERMKHNRAKQYHK